MCDRLYPVVSSTTREALEDDVINGMQIPAGTKVVLHLGALHRYTFICTFHTVHVI